MGSFSSPQAQKKLRRSFFSLYPDWHFPPRAMRCVEEVLRQTKVISRGIRARLCAIYTLDNLLPRSALYSPKWMSHGKNADLFEWWPEIPLFSPGEFFPPSIFGHARCESERWSVYRGPIITIIDGLVLFSRSWESSRWRFTTLWFFCLLLFEKMSNWERSILLSGHYLRSYVSIFTTLYKMRCNYYSFSNPSIRVICRDSDAQDTLTFADEMRITLGCQVSS